MNSLSAADDINSFYPLKTFSPQEKQEALKILDEFVKVRNCTDDAGNYVEMDYYEFYEKKCKTPYWTQYYPALASAFTFYFPKDESESIDLSKGLDTPVINPATGYSLSIAFVDVWGISVDPSTTLDAVPEILSWGILPNIMYFEENYNYFIKHSSAVISANLTIDSVLSLLASLGLQYKAHNNDCALENVIMSHNEKKKLEASLSSLALNSLPNSAFNSSKNKL